MSSVELFQADSWSVRVVDVEGEPWFIAADVSVALGYSATAAALRILDDEDKGMHELHTPGGPQQFRTINEGALFELIVRSTLPSAKVFKRWVTHEVLPAIRRTGTYTAPAHALPVPSLSEALQGWLDTVRELETAKAELEVTAPKVEAFDQLMATDNSSTFEVVAKAVGIGRNNLIELLREWKVLQPKPSRLPYQSHSHLFTVRYGTHYEGGRSVSHATVRVKPEGVAFIARKVANYQLARRSL